MIILFVHQKGGVGKSTAAINTAYEFRKWFKDIALFDLDSQNSVKLFNTLRSSAKHKTIDCFTQQEIEFEKLVKKYKGNKKNILVIDSGGYDSQINRHALVEADILITPVGISQIELFGLQKFRKILKEASSYLKKNVKSNILLNNVDPRSKKAIKSVREYIKKNNEYFNLLDTTLHTRADYKHSYAKGVSVKEYNKKGDAAKEIKSLSKEIKDIILN